MRRASEARRKACSVSCWRRRRLRAGFPRLGGSLRADVGWQGFDPTNNSLVDWRYVKLAQGRDYLDIVPVKGVYRGTPEQTLEVKVDVRLAAGE